MGLHSGEKVQARVLPAAPDTGVEFVRTDMPDSEPIPAQIGYYSDRERRTQLQRGTASVSGGMGPAVGVVGPWLGV